MSIHGNSLIHACIHAMRDGACATSKAPAWRVDVVRAGAPLHLHLFHESIDIFAKDIEDIHRDLRRTRSFLASTPFETLIDTFVPSSIVLPRRSQGTPSGAMVPYGPIVPSSSLSNRTGFRFQSASFPFNPSGLFSREISLVRIRRVTSCRCEATCAVRRTSARFLHRIARLRDRIEGVEGPLVASGPVHEKKARKEVRWTVE